MDIVFGFIMELLILAVFGFFVWGVYDAIHTAITKHIKMGPPEVGQVFISDEEDINTPFRRNWELLLITDVRHSPSRPRQLYVEYARCDSDGMVSKYDVACTQSWAIWKLCHTKVGYVEFNKDGSRSIIFTR